MTKNIDQRIRDFKQDLIQIPSQAVIRKHIIFGECFWLDHELYYELKQEIATEFKIHPSEVIMVGSGKLGFSPSEKKIKDRITGNDILKPRYREFGEESDLDIAILSPNLFDEIWFKLYELKKQRPIWPDEKEFQRYLFSGWMRPDKLPASTSGLTIKNDWFEFFTKLTNSGKYGDYTISAGLYKNWNYLEGYQNRTIEQCKSSLGN